MASLRECFAGGVGGSCMVIIGHPLDTVKVRLQADVANVYRGGLRGMADCLLSTVRQEGTFALYKGVTMPLGATSLVFSLCFSGYHHGKHIFGAGDGALDVGRTMAAGAFSALYTTPVQAPQELVKCRMQHDVGRVSVRDALAQLYAQGGLRAISRGVGITLARDGAASGVCASAAPLLCFAAARVSPTPSFSRYFSTYEIAKDRLRVAGFTDGGGRISFLGIFLAGSTAGICNWIPAIPLDFLKTRYQLAPEGRYSGAVFGSTSVARDVLATDGVRGMFRGTGPIFIRAIPANAACFSGYEAAVRLLDYDYGRAAG